MVGQECTFCEGGPDVAGAFGALASIGGVWILLVLLCFHKKTQSAINARINAVDINVKDVNSDKTNQGEPILATTDNQQNTTPPTPPGNFVHRPAPTPPSFIPPILNPEDKDVDKRRSNGVPVHHHHHYHHRKVGAAGAVGTMGKEQLFNARMSDAADVDGQTKMEWDLVGHQFKIMLTSLQIVSALCVTFDDVAWPVMWKDFTLSLSFVNLDISPVFGFTNCRLSLPFLDKMVLHMCLPLVIIGSVFVVYFLFSCCSHKDAQHAQHALASKIIITTVLLLYPGVCVRVFQVFKCKTIIEAGALYHDSPKLDVLQQDFRIACFSEAHMPYATLSCVALGAYVILIPLILFYLLRTNRPYLFDKTTGEQHTECKASYGSLYLQYEDDYWWWELTIMVKKMMLTGAMVVIAPGSSSQLLIGLLIAILYMLAVLKIAPFLEEADDWLSFTTSLTLVMTLLMGLILKLNKTDYPEDSVGQFLIGMQVFNFVIFIIGLVLLVPCCRARMHRRQRAKEHAAHVRHQRHTTLIHPLDHKNVDATEGGGKTIDIISPDSEATELTKEEQGRLKEDDGASESDSSSDEEDAKAAVISGAKSVKKPGMVSFLLFCICYGWS
jgi:hypothetical protein